MSRVLSVLVLLALAGATWWLSTPDDEDAGRGAGSAGEQPAVEQTVPVGAFAMRVDSVVDGDTFRARVERVNDVVTTPDRISIRLVGIDTPETYPETECWGPEATDAARSLLAEGSTVMVAPDQDSRDQYGRRLFHVWADGQWVNGALVADGHAEAKRYWPNVTRHDELVALMESAREAGRGQWGACG